MNRSLLICLKLSLGDESLELPEIEVHVWSVSFNVDHMISITFLITVISLYNSLILASLIVSKAI